MAERPLPWGALALALCLCAVFGMLSASAWHGDVLAVDGHVQHIVHEWRRPALDFGMRVMSSLVTPAVGRRSGRQWPIRQSQHRRPQRRRDNSP